MDIIEGMVDLELEADLHAGGVGEGGGGGVRGGVSLSSSFVEFEYADVHELGLLRQRLRKSQENFRRERSRYRRLVKEAFAAMYGDGDAAAAAAAASPSPGGVGGGGGGGVLAHSRLAKVAHHRYSAYIAPLLFRVASIVLGACSVCVVLSQVTIYEGLPLWMKQVRTFPPNIPQRKPSLAFQTTLFTVRGLFLSLSLSLSLSFSLSLSLPLSLSLFLSSLS